MTCRFWCHRRAGLGKATEGREAPGGHLGDLGRAMEAGKKTLQA